MTCPSQVFDLALKSSDPTPARRPTAKQALQGIMAALDMNGAVYVCDEPQQVNADFEIVFLSSRLCSSLRCDSPYL